MELIKDMEAFIHLVAQAFAKARGDEQPHIFADTVVGHARDLAAKDEKTNEITEAVMKEPEAPAEQASPPAAEEPATPEKAADEPPAAQ